MLEREKLEFLAAESSNWSIKSGSNLRAAKAIMLQGRDVGNCSDDSIVMADKEKKKKRGNYCAVGGPNMSNCANNNIHRHREYLRIISRRTKLYGRSGFGLSEYTGKISSLLSRRPCALCTLKTLASKASRGLLLLPRRGNLFSRRES